MQFLFENLIFDIPRILRKHYVAQCDTFCVYKHTQKTLYKWEKTVTKKTWTSFSFKLGPIFNFQTPNLGPAFNFTAYIYAYMYICIYVYMYICIYIYICWRAHSQVEKHSGLLFLCMFVFCRAFEAPTERERERETRDISRERETEREREDKSKRKEWRHPERGGRETKKKRTER